MGGYDPERHQRRSVRLKTYDYSLPGPYFVTICVEHRATLLGRVVGDQVRLSPAGLIVSRELQRIADRSPNVSVDAAVIMPNHLHAIISINAVVGATFMAPSSPHDQHPRNTTLDDAPAKRNAISENRHLEAPEIGVRAEAGGSRSNNASNGERVVGDEGAMNDAPTGLTRGIAVGTLGEVVRAFKAASARAVRRDLDIAFAWQGSYYEHVIRHERELRVLWDYIETNPARWADDEFSTP